MSNLIAVGQTVSAYLPSRPSEGYSRSPKVTQIDRVRMTSYWWAYLWAYLVPFPR